MSRLLDGKFPPSNAYAIAPDADPVSVRNVLLALYDLRVRVRRIRADLDFEDGPLGERLAAARIERDLDQGIDNARAFLTRVARRGGRGFAPTDAPAPVAARIERQRNRTAAGEAAP